MAPEARSSSPPHSEASAVPLVSERLAPLLDVHRRIIDARAHRGEGIFQLYSEQEQIMRSIFEERQRSAIPGMTVGLYRGESEEPHLASRNEFYIDVQDIKGREIRVTGYVNALTCRDYPDSLDVLRLIGEPDVVRKEKPARYLRRTWEEIRQVDKQRGYAYKKQDIERTNKMDELRITLAMRYLHVRAQQGTKEGVPPIIVECVEDYRRGEKHTVLKVGMVDSNGQRYSITIPSIVRMRVELQDNLDRLIAETGGYDGTDNLV